MSHRASGGVRKANLCQTVGKLLQDILDLLATASSDTERKILDDWKHRASRTQSQARLNSDEAQPRTVGHNRKCRRWFSLKYYASVMRIKEFYEDNIGRSFTGHNQQRRRWFSRKYYASMMRINEFYEDNIRRSFTGIISNALNKKFGRNH